MHKWFPGRTLIYSATCGHFAVLTPWKMIKNGHFHRLKLVSVDGGAFYMHPMRGSRTFDLSTSGYYKNLTFQRSWHLKFEPFQNVQKVASFHTFENLVIFK